MSTMTKIIVLIAMAVMIYFAYRMLKNNPEMLSKANVKKSFGTMGYLALGLIAFIALLVWVLNHT